jgi:hypothetical protein
MTVSKCTEEPLALVSNEISQEYDSRRSIVMTGEIIE